LVLGLSFPPAARAADSPASVIRVTVKYPGADARTLDATVLTPIFLQVSGVEGMTRIESEAWNDGTGTLTVYFSPTTDMNLAEVRVHNRVNLALPRIPEPCRQLGIPVGKGPAGPPQFWLALTSADPNHDENYLKTCAWVNLKPEFKRVRGVTDVRILGFGDVGMQVLVNPDRLRAYNLSAGDVIDALRRQNGQMAGGTIGSKPFSQYAVTASGRLATSEEFANVILRVSPNDEVLRVKDVGQVEFGAATGGFTCVNGKPAALIAVTAWPRRVTADQFLKAEAVGDLPPGVQFEVIADRAADRLVVVEVGVPPGSGLERTEEVVARATGLIRALPGEPDTFAFAEAREPNSATIFVKVRDAGGSTAADVDKALAGLSSVMIRVGDMPPGTDAFPARIALTDPVEFRDPGERGEERFREAAQQVLYRLAKDKDVAEPAPFATMPVPQKTVDIDRDACAKRGVELKDLFTTLQTSLGGVDATDFHRFGQMYRVTVQTDPRFTRFIDDLEKLFVGNHKGDMVPLSELIKIRRSSGPTAVVRVNGSRAIIITAAPAAGKTPAEAAAKSAKLAQEVLPRGYRVKNLTGAWD
jgi:multidrug efflux pump subunit AcrB